MSTTARLYVTTAIPYVNGDPHLGHALELVQADVLARHRRLRGAAVRLLTGTDDNASKNVAAADAAGIPVAEFVAAKAQRFRDLLPALEVANDDFIGTSTDPRHRPGVERLWRACGAAGDLYSREYRGLYCAGCEAFVGGRCDEHDAVPEPVVERNWFFRLSRHAETLRALIESGRLRIVPEQRRNEVLGLLAAGLDDLSVSRPRGRARGWGIPVPDDPEQVVYVWFDALANYLTALGTGDDYRDWWHGDGERLHVIGKGITRFHALYWPAILLSAGEPLPTTILVHDYLTVEGRKIAKSAGAAVDPVGVVERYGIDALRWWLLRDVPRTGDADFRPELVAARGKELADGLGNLVNRTIALARRHPPGPAPAPLPALCTGLPEAVDAALAGFDLRAASGALWDAVVAGNRFVQATAPWELARNGREEELSAVVLALLDACRTLALELRPFLPGGAERVVAAIDELDAERGRSLFPKSAV